MKEINPIVLVVRGAFFGLFALACSTTPPTTQQEESVPKRVQTREIRVNGVTLNYVDEGTGDPVVFVHGTLGDYRTWDKQIEAFAQKCRAISYSRRYHYPNPWPKDASSFSASVHASDLAEFVKLLQVGRVHLVGHSFGALTSLLVARDNPELILSLTLGEPPVWPLFAPGSEGDSLVQSQVTNSIIPSTEALQDGDQIEGIRLFVNGVLGEGAYDELPPDVRSAFSDNAGELKGAGLSGDNLFPPFTCEDAGKIQVPTLLLEGELSPKMFILVQDILEECLPNDERATIPAASHGLEYENPQAFNETVLAFLARH